MTLARQVSSATENTDANNGVMSSVKISSLYPPYVGAHEFKQGTRPCCDWDTPTSKHVWHASKTSKTLGFPTVCLTNHGLVVVLKKQWSLFCLVVWQRFVW